MLADARARALDVDGLDAALAGAMRCHPPMSSLLADLTVSSLRMGGHPPGGGTLLADLDAAHDKFPPGDRALSDVIAARRLYVDDPQAYRICSEWF